MALRYAERVDHPGQTCGKAPIRIAGAQAEEEGAIDSDRATGKARAEAAEAACLGAQRVISARLNRPFSSPTSSKPSATARASENP